MSRRFQCVPFSYILTEYLRTVFIKLRPLYLLPACTAGERRLILNTAYIHCCQIPPGLLGQVSQKNSAAGEKIRPQAGHPPNHQKKCSKKIFATNYGPIFANYC